MTSPIIVSRHTYRWCRIDRTQNLNTKYYTYCVQLPAANHIVLACHINKCIQIIIMQYVHTYIIKL